jgi:hypothetical protein
MPDVIERHSNESKNQKHRASKNRHEAKSFEWGNQVGIIGHSQERITNACA